MKSAQRLGLSLGDRLRIERVFGTVALAAVRSIADHIEHLLGWRSTKDSADRKLLEEVILPYYAAQPECERVLFVGCDWYTRHYASIFAAQEYWTLDPKPRKKRYGAARHVIDALENLDRWFKPGYFDLVVCNGVFGWGLNGREQCERALANSVSRLRPGGHFVLGWNDVAAGLSFPPLSLAGFDALHGVIFPPLNSDHWLTDTPNRHTYAFFARADDGDGDRAGCRTTTAPRRGGSLSSSGIGFYTA